MASAHAEDAGPSGAPSGRYLAAQALAALGVVYGDIGTSPLYALRESFLEELWDTLTRLDELHWPTFALAMAVLAALLAFGRWAKRWPGPLIAMLAAAAIVQVFGLDRADLQPPAAGEVTKQDQPVVKDVQVRPVAGCQRLAHRCALRWPNYVYADRPNMVPTTTNLAGFPRNRNRCPFREPYYADRLVGIIRAQVMPTSDHSRSAGLCTPRPPRLRACV